MRRLALLITCGVLAACGGSEPLEPRRSSVPVLLYREVDAADFSADMVRLRREGYDTITLPAFIRFLRGQPVSLPPRPLLLTFDDGRADVSTKADPVLASSASTPSCSSTSAGSTHAIPPTSGGSSSHACSAAAAGTSSSSPARAST